MNERTQITLSKEIFAILDFWSWLHGKTPAAYAAQIVSARVEANMDTIRELAQFAAEARGLTVEQLKQEWRDERAGTSPE